MINKAEFQIANGPFEPTVDGLQGFQCPQWFLDAKFGIWSHWGPQCVPMYGDWYARTMYIEGSDQYMYHCRKYGHPSKFGYKDLVKLWKAEKFDPAGLMDLFVESGAKYFVAQAMHHDNFDCFDSKWNEWNSTRMGPMRDICALWQKEAKRCGLPFGLTEHLGASYTWFSTSHGADKTGPFAGVPYDGADPRWQSFYRDNNSELLDHAGTWTWYTNNEKYHKDWLRRMVDVIDKFAPDLFYSDGCMPFGDYGLAMVAHLYNTSAAHNGGVNNALYNFKKTTDQKLLNIGVVDIERGIMENASEAPWQDDTSIGDWFYNVRWKYKQAPEILDTLVDVTAKNGCLLLNVTQKPDGTLDDELVWTLGRIGKWCKENGEGIYGTRPWRTAMEGKTKMDGGMFKETKAEFGSTDFRFTQKDGAVFAFQMRESEDGQAWIKALGRLYHPEIKAVTVCGKPAAFEQRDGALLVTTGANPNPGLPMCIGVK
ncbi:MAG: alpha-L-fucosidase [Oscillospiraceae bacterium]|jgi:alpha-L-fucosidase|nr:alpha-L-fucosidase [Oscillospiraceae bacterium]